MAILLAVFGLGSIVHAQEVVYVDASATGADDGSSWTDAYTHLQDAFDEVNTVFLDHEIRVAEGVYYPDEDGDGDHTADDESESFTLNLSSGFVVAVLGGYPAGGGTRDPDAHVTILSGDITQDDVTNADGVTENASDIQGANSDHVLHIETIVTRESVIDGFTITGGQADGSSFTDTRGGGVFNDGNVAFVDVTLAGNRAEGDGGGMFNNGQSPTINSNGAARPTLVNATFSGNEAENGGGLYNSGNSGEATPAIANALFTDNHAELAGALYNWASRGGTASATLVGVTFAANTATGALDGAIATGGAVHNASTDDGTTELELVNSVLWGNDTEAGADHIYNGGARTTVTISHTILEGGLAAVSDNNGSTTIDGGDILDQDPRFADAAAGDVRLCLGSPAIDAGDNGALPPDTLDIDGDRDTAELLPLDRVGNDRTVAVDATDAIVDMGAYESDGSPVSIVGAEGPPGAFVLHGNVPNPVSGETTIRYELSKPARVTLAVFDVLGRRVATLVDERQAAGRKEVSFQAHDLPSGIYVVRLAAQGRTHTRTLTVVR